MCLCLHKGTSMTLAHAPQMSILQSFALQYANVVGGLRECVARSNPCNQTLNYIINSFYVSLRNTLQFLASAMDKRSYALRVASHNILLLTCYNLFTYLFPTILLQVSISASICCFNSSKLSNVRSGLMKS